MDEIKWRKSSRSEGASECVEVALFENCVAWVRDTKNVGPELRPVGNWVSFVTAIKSEKISKR